MLPLPHPSEPRRLPGWGGDGLELEEVGTTLSCGGEDPSLVFSSWDENVTTQETQEKGVKKGAQRGGGCKARRGA